MSAPGPVYLDYAATTPVDPRVAAAMASCLTLEGDFGNASSGHVFGRGAALRIERARSQVAALIGAEADEIVFTSGATESDNLAVLGVARANADRGRHVVTARTEHKAVLDPCKRLEKEGFRVTYLVPERSGLVTAAAVAAALQPDTQLVSLMTANNEIGVLQDLAAIGELCRERGVALHSDAAQAAGKVPLDVGVLPVDFLSLTAHKLYGPKGVGALYVRRGARGMLQPLLYGGGQEQGLRPGTLATHQIVGFGAACELAGRELPAEAARLLELRERLWHSLSSLGGVHLNGADAPRLPGILNVSFEGVEGESLVTGLGGLAVSTGAACNSASAEASYVLRALGRDALLAASSLRFSLGRFTQSADVDFAGAAVRHEVGRLRALSPASSPQPGAGWVRGEAGGPGEETWVRFQLLVSGNTVKDARVHAFGCPHTLQVATWLCAQLPGRSRAALLPGGPADWAASRSVPVERLGRLLVIEDALKACQLQWP
ncbi:MAG TPA: aminotransferase class V-fold PLP-dependent enzyme [Steroidobacteraceae bacterium]|nr:aminotransferase class V-fold PLP-dependent enzyme [Steroidobacteraceae bacterium]